MLQQMMRLFRRGMFRRKRARAWRTRRLRGVLLPAATAMALVVSVSAQHAGPALETLPLTGQVSLVAGPSGNSVVQVGRDGVLIVDAMSEAQAEALVRSVRTLAGQAPIRYIVNTHGHADHVGGNAQVSASGSQLVGGGFAAQIGGGAVEGAIRSAFIVAHENVLRALSAPGGSHPAVAFAAWPTETFFQSEQSMFFNGEGIQLVFQPEAHSDGDILVHFRRSDVIAAGDLFSTEGFPLIDRARRGHVNGLIEGLNRIIDLAIPGPFNEGGTLVVPGHGRVADEFEVAEYRDMVTIVRDRVQAMLKKQMTVEEVVAARPAFEWESQYGNPGAPVTTAAFVEAVYSSLATVPAGSR